MTFEPYIVGGVISKLMEVIELAESAATLWSDASNAGVMAVTLECWE